MIIGNPIYSNSGGDSIPALSDFTYTGNWRWYNEEQTVLALESSGILRFAKGFLSDIFLVGGGGGGAYNTRGGTTIIGDLTAAGGWSCRTSLAANAGAGGSGGGGYGGNSNSGTRGGAGGSDGSNGANAAGRAGGTGQGSTTRAFAEPDGDLFAGGGGGSGYGYGGAGGAGGGGNGGRANGGVATAGSPNTGGGGGGYYSNIGCGGGYTLTSRYELGGEVDVAVTIGAGGAADEGEGAAGGSGIILIRAAS